MRTPAIENLIRALRGLLAGFVPAAVTYLGTNGRWEAGPSSTRDRISNELWFHLWSIDDREVFSKQAAGLLTPLAKDQAGWEFTVGLACSLAPGSEVVDSEILQALESLYSYIEYDAYRRNSTAYVADWDYAGKRVRSFFRNRAGDYLEELRLRVGSMSRTVGFMETVDFLGADRDSTFASVSSIIADEERARRLLVPGAPERTGATPADEVYGLLAGGATPMLDVQVTTPSSLLRPYLELLTDPGLTISSGAHYAIADFLAALKDVRSTAVLLEALRGLDPGYTDLRANVVYALGNLKQAGAVEPLVELLGGRDTARPPEGKIREGYRQALDPEKREAIWALGRMGPLAAGAVPPLAANANRSDRETKIYLAWAMGTIGSGQRELQGGMDEAILPTLKTLVTSHDKAVFEEAASAMELLGERDFVQRLHLHDFAVMPVLALKPSRTGLYELSETILHLSSVRKPLVMAVTGDSGTGKTYFCQAIASGFGSIKPGEILYLMRDRAGDKTLDRILGIKWLLKHVEPRYYEDYPIAEAEDDPDLFFESFINQHSGKKLIILDGWRDQAYFHQIIKTFYDRGYLDILVRFQSTFSTRRINLEEREKNLERVRDHLALVEKPSMEETNIYQEGAVLIYDLDNSLPARLDREEIQEVFRRKKIDTWVDHIRLGHFRDGLEALEVSKEIVPSASENFRPGTERVRPARPETFIPEETRFSRTLNPDPDGDPNLLEVVRLDGIGIRRIAFYTQGQVAFCGDDGEVGVLVGLNDAVLYRRVHAAGVSNLAVTGGEVYSVDESGVLRATSFKTGETLELARLDSAASAIAVGRDGRVATGHLDGTVRVWDLVGRTVEILEGHRGRISYVGFDRGRTISSSDESQIRVWDLSGRRVNILENHGRPIRAAAPYVDGRLVVARDSIIGLVDGLSSACEVLRARSAASVNAIGVYFDGRLLIGSESLSSDGDAGTLVVADPRPGFYCYKRLPGHELRTTDCLTMGPRIITCGRDRDMTATIRIWGPRDYVRIEIGKARLMPEDISRPPYYRSLF